MATKKITELPFINTLSGSSVFDNPTQNTVVPVVLYGTTNQITVENFSKFTNLYAAQTGSQNIFTQNQWFNATVSASTINVGTLGVGGNTTIAGTLGVTGNGTIGGNLAVAGRITAEEFYTEITTASVIYASGSTKFGDDTGDKHEFTGSINVSGSVIYNGVILSNIDANTIQRLQQTTQSLQVATASLQTFTASQDGRNFILSQVTGSFAGEIGGLEAYSASLKSAAIVSSSTQIQNYNLFAVTSSDNTFYGTQRITGSLSISRGQFNVVTASGGLTSSLTFTHNITSPGDGNAILELRHNNRIYNDDIAIKLKADFAGAYLDYEEDTVPYSILSVQSFANKNVYIHQDTRLLFSNLTVDDNLVVKQDTKMTGSLFVMGVITGSILATNGVISSSNQLFELNQFTASQDSRNLTLSQVTGSLIGITNGLMAFTAALDNTYATDAQLYQLYQATRSLELHSGSMIGVTNGLMAYTASNTTLNTGLRGEVDGIEAYTASLKGQAIVSSSTQVQNYDVFGLNSNLYTATGSLIGITNGLMAFTAALDSTYATDAQLYQLYAETASIKAEIAGIEAYTASLKGAAIVSSSHQITNLGFITSSQSASFNLIGFNTSAGVSVGVGQLAWNNTDGTLDLGMKGGNVVQQIGQEIFYEVRNETGIQIPNGTAVYANGVTAGSGRITAAPYVADGSVRENRFLGLATENISTGVNGFVTYFGYVRGLDTRGDVVSSIAVGDETWAVGDILYVHPTVAGKLTNVKPQHEITVAIIITRHQSVGVLFVRPSSGGHLEDIHDILINTGSLTNGQVLSYNSTSGLWVNTNKLTGSYGIQGTLELNGDILGNVPLNTFTGSLRSEVNGIEAYTASLKGAIEVSGQDVNVLGMITAQQFNVTYVSSSVMYRSGSTEFGDSSDDRHLFTGSLIVSGTLVAGTDENGWGRISFNESTNTLRIQSSKNGTQCTPISFWSQRDGGTFAESMAISGSYVSINRLAASANYKLGVSGSAYINGANDKGIFVTDNATFASIVGLNSAISAYNPLELRASGTDYQLYLPTTGEVLMGSNSVGAQNSGAITFRTTTAAYGGVIIMNHSTTNNTGAGYLDCYYNTSYIGGIQQNGASNVAFNTSSDYRLKEDLKDFNGLNLISNLKVYDFKWKTDNTRMYGVLAHELQEIIPYVVNGNKDGVKEDGKIKVQVVDYSKIVPILIKSIQEQQDIIEELKARIEALENK